MFRERMAIAQAPTDTGNSFHGETRDPDGLIIRIPAVEIAEMVLTWANDQSKRAEYRP
ncbi:MAG: hypothetical protein HS132_18175 [Planctomycetia bacterium]|nr:hypothetical protein [Planctomycetia bacterium]